LHICLIKKNAFDTKPLVDELATHPHLWNAIKLRTEHPRSPHREVDDIWIRYNPQENYKGDIRPFNEEHTPEWYSAAQQLPAIKEASEWLLRQLGGLQLGAVLVTRITPGSQVYPHIDQGWHARTFDKYCIQIKGNLEQAFHFEGEELRTTDGDVFWFDNSAPHWVTNESSEERMSLIVCIRRGQCL
jgi:quercetin dioxygenase-like cupin family protein